MSHGEQSERTTNKRPRGDVSVSTVVPPEASGSERRPDEGTSPTMSMRSSFGSSLGVRPYVAEIDRLVESFRTGEKPRFEVISAITRHLNADTELSPQERAQSFELYMAEIVSIPETPRNKGKGRAEARFEPILGNVGEIGRVVGGDESKEPDDDGSDGGSSSSSSGSESDRPRKKKKLHQSDMPWSGRKAGFTQQHPSCEIGRAHV